MNKIAVVGAGYVGLVTGVCLAEKDNFVTIIEKDKSKIDSLLLGKVPFYEPGLDELLKSSIKSGRIVFSDSLTHSLQQKPEIIFSCVGTPSLPSGDADLSAVYQVAKAIGQNLSSYCLIVNKSTVPVGTAKAVYKIINNELDKRSLKMDFDIASNPEFLKEGDAINDFLMPDRIIAGICSQKAEKILKKLYKPFYSKEDQFLIMNLESAELTKYASNAMLATRISFVNELALLADKVGADIFDVKRGMSKDLRIGSAFLNAGIGYGGSCFPKDVKALVKIGEKHNQKMSLVSTVDHVNDIQVDKFINKVIHYYGRNLSNKKVGIWGLSFKPETDDIRNAPSLKVIEKLISYEAEIIAYDPQAQENIKKVFDQKISFDSANKILERADFLIILTEWNEFLNYNTNEFKQLNDKIIFDGRNCFDPIEMKKAGIKYFNIGRNSTEKLKELNSIFIKNRMLKELNF